MNFHFIYYWIGLWLPYCDLSTGGGLYLPFDFIYFKEDYTTIFYSEKEEIIYEGKYIHDSLSISVDTLIKFENFTAVDLNLLTCNIDFPQANIEERSPIKIKMVKLTPIKISNIEVDSILSHSWLCKEKNYIFYSDKITLTRKENYEDVNKKVFALDHIADYWFIKVIENKMVLNVLPIVSMSKNEIKIFSRSLRNETLTLAFTD